MIAASSLLFDLDGTLVDSLPDLATALNLLRTENGLAPLPLSTVRAAIGDGARKLVERCLPAGLCTEAQLQRFLTLYGQHLTDATRPYDGILPLLQALRERGTPLAVVTNKPIGLTRALLDGLGLTPYFASVLGGDSGPTKKPDPGMIHAALAITGGTPATAIVIGDHHTDLHAGRAAGCRTVFCAWGFGHDGGLDPTWRAADPAALTSLLLAP